MIATTMFGLEDILEKELIKLGAKKIKKGNRCIYFQGNQQCMYDANIRLRTALKILKVLQVFKTKSETELYKHIRRIKWHNILSTSNTFSVNSTVNSKYFTHSHYVSLVVKDAIVDHFKQKFKKRPSVDTHKPQVNIHIHISNNKCTLSLNSSGDSLHKRGYRSSKFHAPINEVLAAGIILLSDWNKKTTLIDPMCGSGTFIIEAALIAMNKSPNIYRKIFGFQNWRDYNQKVFEEVKEAAIKRETPYHQTIKGYDISASTISMAKQHVNNMKLNNIVEVHGGDFFKLKGDKTSTLIFNPPYGKRIEIHKNYYTNIGNTLKHNYSGISAWIITSELQEIKKIGLRSSKKIKLFNGPLECRLVNYNLYEGSKKLRKLKM